MKRNLKHIFINLNVISLNENKYQDFKFYKLTLCQCCDMRLHIVCNFQQIWSTSHHFVQLWWWIIVSSMCKVYTTRNPIHVLQQNSLMTQPSGNWQLMFTYTDEIPLVQFMLQFICNNVSTHGYFKIKSICVIHMQKRTKKWIQWHNSSYESLHYDVYECFNFIDKKLIIYMKTISSSALVWTKILKYLQHLLIKFNLMLMLN